MKNEMDIIKEKAFDKRDTIEKCIIVLGRISLSHYDMAASAAEQLAALRAENATLKEQNGRFVEWHAEQGRMLTELRAQLAEMKERTE